jgi:hypothetical protein
MHHTDMEQLKFIFPINCLLGLQKLITSIINYEWSIVKDPYAAFNLNRYVFKKPK